jgi:alkylated DNA repair protein alkB homolog 1
VVLPSFLSHEKQRELVKWSLSEHSKQPNETNLDIHYVLPPEGVWNAYVAARSDTSLDIQIQPKFTVVEPSEQYQEQDSGPRQLINNTPADSTNFDSLHNVLKLPASPSPTAQPSSPSILLPKLRWANIGWFYHWGTKQYDFTKGKIEVHDKIRDVCKHAVRAVDWKQVFEGDKDKTVDLDWGEGGPEWMDWNETYGTSTLLSVDRATLTRRAEPDAGIVNFYQTKVCSCLPQRQRYSILY